MRRNKAADWDKWAAPVFGSKDSPADWAGAQPEEPAEAHSEVRDWIPAGEPVAELPELNRRGGIAMQFVIYAIDIMFGMGKLL